MVSLSATPTPTTTTTVAESPSAVYVFVFAHPDDESMFFLPTIRSLVDAGEKVWLLCLTTGNYDGLGKLREKEMEQAGKLLGVSKVIVRNDCTNSNGNENSNSTGNDGRASILDHPTKRYDKTIVARAIRDSLSRNGSSSSSSNQFVLITFDAMGVSGHVNHTDVYLGVLHLMEELQQQQQRKKKISGTTTIRRDDENETQEDNPLLFLEAWYLASEQNFLFKYVPVLSWILLLVSCFASNVTSTVTSTLSNADTTTTSSSSSSSSNNTSSTRCTTRIFRMHDPRLNWTAMATHRSQFVWYRRLFVVFSSYTYYNKLLCTKKPTPNR
jgi:LmbE family N-acetylglucosaminyl deacetylase